MVTEARSFNESKFTTKFATKVTTERNLKKGKRVALVFELDFIPPKVFQIVRVIISELEKQISHHLVKKIT